MFSSDATMLIVLVALGASLFPQGNNEYIVESPSARVSLQVAQDAIIDKTRKHFTRCFVTSADFGMG